VIYVLILSSNSLFSNSSLFLVTLCLVFFYFSFIIPLDSY
jgi:hypothetical protein